MNVDFAFILVILTFASGLIWLADKYYFAGKRSKPGNGQEKKEPLIVEYSKSFFPIFLIVLILRSFIMEPFKIPSASMMPTLLIGDFILVNKYIYGVRLPVINTKIIDVAEPERGEIAVFRYPRDPSIPYIKRIVGLPGDHVAYRNKIVYINHEPVITEAKGRYKAEGAGFAMNGALVNEEFLGNFHHEILIMENNFSFNFEGVVPDQHYFVLGDNRDNSKDSRFWGFVPEKNLMGRAFMIWMNWDGKKGGIDWKRIGRIE